MSKKKERKKEMKNFSFLLWLFIFLDIDEKGGTWKSCGIVMVAITKEMKPDHSPNERRLALKETFLAQGQKIGPC